MLCGWPAGYPSARVTCRARTQYGSDVYAAPSQCTYAPHGHVILKLRPAGLGGKLDLAGNWTWLDLAAAGKWKESLRL